ncbi:hypothetical protein TBC1_111486 [Lentimicrobium saccharophilum]|uniref:Uncharacterized protein n=1 Tax=Lentimicrobium saccharophilum TaxID=1678841 RepID=A0A0S7BR86_9BACT|nr:hypothetical protein TBC1_111486 [Lentimicrobium saccharophilum]
MCPVGLVRLVPAGPGWSRLVSAGLGYARPPPLDHHRPATAARPPLPGHRCPQARTSTSVPINVQALPESGRACTANPSTTVVDYLISFSIHPERSGGAGDFTFFTGLASSSFSSTSTAFSMPGSMPLASCSGRSTTSISG